MKHPRIGPMPQIEPFRSPRSRTLGKGIAPAVLRLGGTSSDGMIFIPPHEKPDLPPNYREEVNLTANIWDEYQDFASATGMQFLFGLNALTRLKSSWYPGNARQLLEYSVSKGYCHINFELANEPDVYPVKFNTSISGTELGKEFKEMVEFVHSFGSCYNKSYFVGPDIATLHIDAEEIAKDWLDTVGELPFAFTFHHYYFDGKTANTADYINPEHLKYLQQRIETIKTWLQKTSRPEVTLWLGEAGTSYDGGTANISNTYGNAFLYLDLLGTSAKSGVDLVARYAWHGIGQSLVDYNQMPMTDYWLAHVYKLLVGAVILPATVNISTHQQGYVRMYSHCTETRKGYKRGAVTIYGMNLLKWMVHVTFDPVILGDVMDVYHMTPANPGDIHSRDVCLNGQVLKMVDDYTLPDIKPVSTATIKGFSLGSLTYVFLVFPQADFTSCH